MSGVADIFPDMVFTFVTDITAEKLREMNISALACDLDGTLADSGAPLPDDKIVRWLKELTLSGIDVIVISNNRHDRVSVFCEKLGVPYISRARKPRRAAFLEAAKLLGRDFSSIAVAGDKILTDIIGAKRCGMKSMLVEPIGVHKHPLSRVRRFVQKIIIRKKAN